MRVSAAGEEVGRRHGKPQGGDERGRGRHSHLFYPPHEQRSETTVSIFAPSGKSKKKKNRFSESPHFFSPFCGHAHLQRSRGLFFQSLVTEADESFSELSPLVSRRRRRIALCNLSLTSAIRRRRTKKTLAFAYLCGGEKEDHTQKKPEMEPTYFFSLGPSG